MSTITNNGYIAKVSRDAAGGFTAQVVNAVGLPDFEAKTYRELTARFAEVVQAFLDDCRAKGVTPPALF